MERKVLIFEYAPYIAEALELLIEMKGYRPLVANSCEEGLRLAKEQRPDLILMDLVMPDLDGTNVARWIRSDPRTASIPIAVMSVCDNRLERDLIEAGCTEIFNKIELMACFDQTLNKYLEIEKGDSSITPAASQAPDAAR